MRRKMAQRDPNRYEAILGKVFLDRYKRGAREMEFERRDFGEAAQGLGITLPKNLGDIIYSFRYRRPIPQSIMDTAHKGHAWVIRPAGLHDATARPTSTPRQRERSDVTCIGVASRASRLLVLTGDRRGPEREWSLKVQSSGG